ncbi:MAG: hypothetical protein JRN45_00525 [Nitrososphaerota archaeon]|nr:hypothetical protein [Nitrososphaerota archaeon]
MSDRMLPVFLFYALSFALVPASVVSVFEQSALPVFVVVALWMLSAIAKENS